MFYLNFLSLNYHQQKTYLDIPNCNRMLVLFFLGTFRGHFSLVNRQTTSTFEFFIVMKKLCFDYFVKGYSFDWKYNEIFRCVLIIIKFIRHLTALVTKVLMHFSMHCIFLSWLKIVIDSIDISCFDSIRLVLLNDLQIAKK